MTPFTRKITCLRENAATQRLFVLCCDSTAAQVTHRMIKRRIRKGCRGWTIHLRSIIHAQAGWQHHGLMLAANPRGPLHHESSCWTFHVLDLWRRNVTGSQTRPGEFSQMNTTRVVHERGAALFLDYCIWTLYNRCLCQARGLSEAAVSPTTPTLNRKPLVDRELQNQTLPEEPRRAAAALDLSPNVRVAYDASVIRLPNDTRHWPGAFTTTGSTLQYQTYSEIFFCATAISFAEWKTRTAHIPSVWRYSKNSLGKISHQSRKVFFFFFFRRRLMQHAAALGPVLMHDAASACHPHLVKPGH
ncbi:hypothetical protein BJV74DRAFT_191086 [Russula compacta]|nr:hypothetical protein BJV74DRAFT_191086 [Russula compacta]